MSLKNIVISSLQNYSKKGALKCDECCIPGLICSAINSLYLSTNLFDIDRESGEGSSRCHWQADNWSSGSGGRYWQPNNRNSGTGASSKNFNWSTDWKTLRGGDVYFHMPASAIESEVAWMSAGHPEVAEEAVTPGEVANPITNLQP
jgi:hypothetical protein